MAIYKPNNFYPYMQEVDLESIDGVTFSCQVNTDGNSMIRAARLRILDKDNNIVLYEKIQNLNFPIKNGEIVEFQVEPFYLSSGNINFISLTPNIDIDERITYCPYNLYQSQLYNNDYFKIIEVSFDENNNVRYNEIREYNVDMEDNNYILSFTENTSLSYYTVLKNNNDYVWNIELFEHTINTSEYDETLVGESKIVGSIESVIWVNKKNQTNQTLINLEKLKNENDLYIEAEFTEDNSNFHKRDILKGYSTKGNITIKETNENDEKFNLDMMVGNFIFEKKKKVGMYPQNSSINSAYRCPVYDTDVYFGDFYEMTDYGRKKKDPKSYIKINLNPSMKKTLVYTVGSNCYSYIYRSSYKEKQWHYLENVQVYIENINGEKFFQFEGLENAEIGDICYRVYRKDDRHDYYIYNSIGKLADDLPDNNDYITYPFACNNAETHIVCMSVPANGSNKQEITAINDSTRTMYGYDGEMVAVINDTLYRLKVLNPRPVDICPYGYNGNSSNSGFYMFSYSYRDNRGDVPYYARENYNVDYNNTVQVGYSVSIDLKDDCISYDNNGKIISDIECFGSNKYFNAVEDIFYLRTVWFLCSHIENNGVYTVEGELYDTDNYKIKINCIPDYIQMNVNEGFNYRISYELSDPNINFSSFLMDENFLNGMSLDIFKEIDGKYKFSVPYLYDDGFVKLSIDSFDLIDTKFQKFEFSEISSSENKNALLLDENCIDFSDEQNIYVDIILKNNEDEKKNKEYFDLKVFQFYNINKQIVLEDSQIQEEIYTILKEENNYDCMYQIKMILREEVSNISKRLGIQNNFIKFELVEAFPYYLYDTETIALYPTNNETTPSSFFGVCDSDLNVEYLYVRFPNYEGSDSNNNYITKQDYAIQGTLSNDYYHVVENTENENYPYKTHGKYGENGDIGYIGPFLNSEPYYTKSDSTLLESDLLSPNFDIDPNTGKPTSESTVQPVSIYGTNVKKEVFEQYGDPLDKNNYHYYKLFKVTSYNYETGEIIIAGGLNRNILITDQYELWEGNMIEGSSNEYDITEVISTYTRIYPENFDISSKPTANGEILFDDLKIANTSEVNLFITPHSNFKFPEYNNSYLCIDDKRIYLPGRFILEKYGYKDSSIDKLDNSQWLISVTGNGSRDYIEKYCSLYQDVISSEYNYFYGRKSEELKLYSIPIETFDANNLEDVEIQDNLFDNKIDGEYIIINNLDFYIYGIYSHSDPLKRYYIKIYDQDMNIVYDSTYIYDSKILYRIKGLNNNSIYYITIECENQLGNIVIYEQLLKVQYLEEIEESIKLKIENNCEQSAVSVTFLNAEDNSYCSFEDFLSKNSNMSDTDNIRIYRKNQYGNIKWLTDINLQDDRIAYIKEGNVESKYSFIDYNVGSNEKYEYIAVLDSVKSSDSKTYNVIKDSIVTNFNVWSIMDIVQSDEDEHLYSVVSDIWSFSYNLESEGLTQNTSTTTWDTLGRYGQVGKGEKNFISSGLKCLLGDVGYYQTYNNEGQLIKKYGYNEKDISSPEQVPINNITKYKKWTKFCNSFSKKLLKDLKGNKWIVQIVDNPSTTNDDKSHAQLYTIAFSWHEIMNSDDISIVNKNLDNELSSDIYNYYEGKNVFPSPVSLFTIEKNENTKTALITGYEGDLSDVVVPYMIDGYTITSIGNNVFFGSLDDPKENLTNVVIPNTVISIGESVFASCTNLTNIIIPDGVTSIGEFSFSLCTGLTSIRIPDGVTSIEQGVFEFCGSLTNITIPDSVTNIENNAFFNCGKLTRLTIPDSVKSIGARAFKNCGNLINITIPDKVTTIDDETFMNCSSLRSIKIPDSITRIGEGAFKNCTSLTEVIIPDSVTEIGESAFEGCTNLVYISIGEESNDTINPNNVILGITENINDINIGNNAFKNCTNVTNIKISDNVSQIGTGVFEGCKNVEKIEIPFIGNTINDSMPLSYLFGGTSYNNNSSLVPKTLKIINITNSTSVANYAFRDCTSLTSITIPDSVTSIGDYAFQYCTSLTSIIIPENVTSISDHMFASCWNLTSVIIPDSVTTIGTYAFFDCKKLENINLKNVQTINVYAFGKCTNLTSVNIPSSVTNMVNPFVGCSNLTEINVDENNSTYCNYGGNVYKGVIDAFDINLEEFYTSLNELVIYIPGQLSSSFEIPYDYGFRNNVSSISDYAFRDCTSLTDITIPESVTSIGGWAFYGCSSLENVYYRGSEEEWNNINIKNSNEPLLNATITYNYS